MRSHSMLDSLTPRLLTLLTALSLCTILCSTHAQAQPVALNETFDDNRNEWWIGSTETGSGRVADGAYLMTCTSSGGWWYSQRSTFIDPARDFTIEVKLRQKRGSQYGGFGVLFGLADLQNLNQFVIASNGGVHVSNLDGGMRMEILPWTVSKAVKPTGELNSLTVERRGFGMRFLVNGTEVALAPAPPMKGMQLGIMVSDTMTVAFEGITVRQEQKIRLVPNAPKSVTKVNLGPNVNSEYEEIGPIISHDGNTLYFSVNYHPENEGGVADADEIWYSTFDGKSWGKRVRMARPLNTVQSNWVISVTPDNNSLLLANLYNPDGSAGGAGISMSQRTANGWSLPRQVFVHGLVNNSGWQQFGLSSDRRVLLLSVTGEPTYGDHDLYVSFLQGDGSWSRPKNLGATVNTLGAEASPYLAADGITLYFSTNGRPGYGQSDIYVTRRLDSTWTNWSEPENLGPAINTTGNESYFTVPASGEFAYMNSSHTSLGKSDIFRIALPPALRPRATVLVYGNVLNSKTKAPLGAEITYRDLATDSEIGAASSDPATGAYKIVLPAGKVYSFMAGLEGYYAVSDNLDVKAKGGYQEIKRDLLLTPIEVGATIRLNNIFFDFAKSELRNESYPELKRAAQFLRDNPSVAIEIGGHTDNVGADDDNRALSEARAAAVRQYLTAEGIDPSRLASKGFGETKPVGSNSSESGRQLNRRVEFVIVRR